MMVEPLLFVVLVAGLDGSVSNDTSEIGTASKVVAAQRMKSPMLRHLMPGLAWQQLAVYLTWKLMFSDRAPGKVFPKVEGHTQMVHSGKNMADNEVVTNNLVDHG